MTYTPIGETVNLEGAVFELAVNRLVKGALQGVNTRYQALLEADSAYQAFLAEADGARANARTYRQMAKTLGQQAEEYAKRLDKGATIDGKEITAALMESQSYDSLAEAEEEKTVPSPELNARLRKLRENAFNGVAGQLGYNAWEKVQTEAARIEGEIMADINRRLDAEEKQMVATAHRDYLARVQSMLQASLSGLSEYVYVGEPTIVHVDGALRHETLVSIFTDTPDVTAEELQRELEMPEGVLTLASKILTPLGDGTGLAVVEARYRGSKPLH
ncbi:MAG: hypothetical protein HYT72_01515 [Candidatus Aenigmarchaeota archaeon]|nr:hypothetical protein [Candidatus Aenigmarchaeota archaeon]